MKHVPGFIEKADLLKSKGVDEILCISGIFLYQEGSFSPGNYG